MAPIQINIKLFTLIILNLGYIICRRYNMEKININDTYDKKKQLAIAYKVFQKLKCHGRVKTPSNIKKLYSDITAEEHYNELKKQRKISKNTNSYRR